MVRLLSPAIDIRAPLIAALTLLAAPPTATADAGHGRAVFAAQCAMCHPASRNDPTILGPPLFGVVGRKAGSFASYAYSPTMHSAGFVWTDDRLHAFLPAPAKMLPRIKMTYGGLKIASPLDDLIAFLNTQK
jgi:cytochrome c